MQPDPKNKAFIIPSREVYDAHQGLNYSGSKALIQSGAHFAAYLNQTREETKALKIGSAVHAFALTPEIAHVTYAVAPEVDRRTKDGKMIWENFVAANAGKTILSDDEWSIVSNVAFALSRVVNALPGKRFGAEFMLGVDYNGTPLKAALDLVQEDENGDLWIYDLKTTEDASPKGFLQSARSYRYNLQAAFYRLVLGLAYPNRHIHGFRFIACEKSAPYATATYQLGPELMSYAIADLEACVKAYNLLQDLPQNEWPGYPADVQVIDINAPAAKATAISFA